MHTDIYIFPYMNTFVEEKSGYSGVGITGNVNFLLYIFLHVLVSLQVTFVMKIIMISTQQHSVGK